MDELWAASAQVGYAFAESPLVRQTRETVTAARRIEAVEPWHHLLSMVVTSGPFPAQPLLLGLWLRHTPQGQQLGGMTQAQQLLADSTRVSAAFLLTIEWLRSWLPGYPIQLHLPHVDILAARVARDGFPNAQLPWPWNLRRSGIQFQPEVDLQVGDTLKIDPQRVREPLLDLRRALWSSDHWRAFAEARRQLEHNDYEHLRELVTQFRSLVKAAETGEGRLMHYEQSVRAALHQVERQAETHERVASYYRAFRQLDLTLDGVGAMLSQVAVDEQLESVRPEQAVWIRDEERQVRFTITNRPLFPRINQVLHLQNEVPSLRRLVRVVGTSFDFDHRRGEQLRTICVTLDEGADAMMPPPVIRVSRLLEAIRVDRPRPNPPTR